MSTAETSRNGGTGSALLIAVAILVALAALMPTTMFWDRDEAFYARTAVEMLETGNYLVPHFNGDVFAHKPPLIYWLMAGSMAVFGENEFAARFISAPATAATAFLLFLIGRRMFGTAAGFWAMLLYPSSLLVAYLGATAMLDATLIGFICLAMWAYIELVYDGTRPKTMAVVFGIAIALSMLTKGPVGPAVVIPAVAISWLLLDTTQRPAFKTMVLFALSSIGGLGLFLLWAVPANMMSGGELYEAGVGIHIVGRFLQPMEGHGGSGLLGYIATLPVYVPVILIGISPWIMHLPAAARAIFSGSLGSRVDRIVLLSWFAPAFVIFSLAATKLPHYVAPVFPALALTVAAFLVQTGPIGKQVWLRIGASAYLVFTLTLAAAVIGLGVIGLGGLGWGMTALIGVLITGFAVAIFRLQWKGEIKAATRLTLATVFPVLAVLQWVVVPQVETALKVTKPLAEIISATRASHSPVYTVSYREPSLIFYLGLPHDEIIDLLPTNEEARREILSGPDEKIIIALANQVEAIQNLVSEGRLETVGRVSGYNTNSGGEFQSVVVLKVKAQQDR
jgi:4-amino-4-deoxy-L-arabinose transferase-like glycosyltransferase